MIKIPSNDIVSRELVSKINVECEKSDRLMVAKVNTVSKPYKQDYKSKLMSKKYSLLPINPQQLTPAQTASQRMSEKHPDFEIRAVNTIRPPDIEYTQNPNHWYQLIPHYRSLENTFLDNQTLIKCKNYRNMHDIWTGITNPGTRSYKSVPNIGAFFRHLSLHNRWKITIWQ